MKVFNRKKGSQADHVPEPQAETPRETVIVGDLDVHYRVHDISDDELVEALIARAQKKVASAGGPQVLRCLCEVREALKDRA